MFLVFYIATLLLNPPNFYNKSFVVFDSEDGFKFITNDSLYFTTDGIEFKARKHNFDIDVYRLEPVAKAERGPITFFVSSGGGVVHRYDEVLDTLVRIDNSYLFMSRFGESKVSRKDTIFSYGGYGEFNYSNKLISFRQDFREWNVEPIEEPLPRPTRKNIIQYDTLTNDIYVGFGDYSFFEDGVEKIESTYEINMFDSNNKVVKVGSFKSLMSQTSDSPVPLTNYKRFNGYRLPLLYLNQGLWSIDLIQQKAIHHIKADMNRLQQYTDILAYNSETGRFLMAYNMLTYDPS
ncbi:MAG: hypothetical protein ACO3Q3_02640, partial [Flavobacteriaceae bacterium]